MTVHITNIYGMMYSSVAQLAQNWVADLARNNLKFKEISIFEYSSENEPVNEQSARFDGMIPALAFNDTVIFQSPSWNPIEWDQAFFDHLNAYDGVKKIVFIEDVIPLMFEVNYYLLPKFIKFYNSADCVIAPSEKMVDFLREHGMTTKKVVIQKFWDHPCHVNPTITPQNSHIINFAGNPKKFSFVNDWAFPNTKLYVFGDTPANPNPNVTYTGWLDDQIVIEKLRENGGFGLVWAEDPYWVKYMKLNASYKLSTYLAAGIPVIINSDTPAKDAILENHLGIIADSLGEAVDQVNNMSDFEYNEMIHSVDSFARLLRGGYFTQKALIDAVVKTRFE